jgi:phenylacetate-CoA ligase
MQVLNEKYETLSRDELESIRNERLPKQFKFAYENSLYYKRKLDEIGAKPEDIDSLAKLRKLPILINKEMERQSRDESIKRYGHPFGIHLCVPIEKLIVAKTTGGTTGHPTFTYTFTEYDLWRWKEGLGRAFFLSGVRPSNRVLFCFGLSGGWAGSEIKSAFQHIGALPIEAGAESGTSRIFYLAELANVDVMTATPSLTEYIIEKAKIENIDLKKWNLERILSTGEPGVGLKNVREKVESAFGCKWFDFLMPCSEAAAGSCDSPEYMGMHELAPEMTVYIDDLVDPQTKEPIELKDGAVGEGVITSLDREGLPLLKYGLGDIVQVFTKPCSCGYPGPGYRFKVIGRSDDLLIVKGVNVYPAAIKEIISSFGKKVTGHLRILLNEPPPRVTPPLKIKLEFGPNVDADGRKQLNKDIAEKLHKILKIRPEIELVPPETLERTGGKTKSIEKVYE